MDRGDMEDCGSAVLGWFLSLLVMYIVPSVVGCMQRHHDAGVTCALNLRADRTVPGRIAAFVWRLANDRLSAGDGELSCSPQRQIGPVLTADCMSRQGSDLRERPICHGAARSNGRDLFESVRGPVEQRGLVGGDVPSAWSTVMVGERSQRLCHREAVVVVGFRHRESLRWGSERCHAQCLTSQPNRPLLRLLLDG